MAFLSGSKIDEFCTKGYPVWVKNRTGTVLLIDMPSPNGPPVQLRIGPGQEPFCISDYFPPDMIRQAAVLRRLVSEGKVILLDPEDPNLKGKRSASPVAVAGATKTAEERAKAHGEAKEDVGEALDPDLEEVEASPKVSVLCDAILHGDVKPDQFEAKIAEIESKEGLSEIDLGYIISELKERPEIVEWATNQLAAKREAVENDEDEEEEISEDESLEESAKELIARSRVRESNTTDRPGPGSVKTEHNTMSGKERKEFKKNLRG